MLAVGALVISLGATASQPESGGGLTSEDAVAIELLDPEAAVEAGWPATLEDIEARAIAWYDSERVQAASDDELERAIAVLTTAISDPPTEREPDQVMYVTEMIYRREAACRSLSSENPLRGEYCSESSVPDLDVEAVPWSE